ncbi:MAG: Uma2 family endonuclease [Gemmataceae bacterium]|nr:Uma2 family endonuclease [Gemmataceae bacterium]
MSSNKPRTLVRLEYARAAEAYLHSLPLEHFMEATAQATQRTITLESLDLVHALRPDFQVFNELLVQYPFGRSREIRQVVPDNMVVVHDEPIDADGSFDVPLQPVGPFWVLEYVSKNSRRKDYEDSFRKYERELKVPYYLLFYPDGPELTLFRLVGKKYVSVTADAAGRHPLAEVELAVALHDGWVRFWHQDQLLPLPADLQSQVAQLQTRLDQTQRQLEQERAEIERLRAQLRKLGVSGD